MSEVKMLQVREKTWLYPTFDHSPAGRHRGMGVPRQADPREEKLSAVVLEEFASMSFCRVTSPGKPDGYAWIPTKGWLR